MTTLFDAYESAEHAGLFALIEEHTDECYKAASERRESFSIKIEEGDRNRFEWWNYDKFYGTLVVHPKLGRLLIRADPTMVIVYWKFEEPPC